MYDAVGAVDYATDYVDECASTRHDLDGHDEGDEDDEGTVQYEYEGQSVTTAVEDTTKGLPEGDELPEGGLPEGWRVETKVRQTGRTAGMTDTYYHSPDGKRCRSMPEVLHLASLGVSSLV